MTTAEKLIQIAENEPRVYQAGIEEGVEQGRKAEYDAFWDDYQQNGERVNYNYGFYNKGWADASFKPKYNIIPTRANQMFAESYISDLVGILENCGVTLDLSQATNIYMTFYWCLNLTRVPVVDTRACTNDSQTFTYLFGSDANLISIEKLILKDDGSQPFANTFSGCYKLQEIRIEGTIGQNGFNVSPCTKLSKASITSIINALSSTTSGLTVTLSKVAVDAAFEGGSAGAEWTALKNTRTNWTISLV